MVKSNHTGLKAGFGLAAVVAAAAGAYYFYGKDAEKRRAHLKSWMVKAKGEVMEQLEKVSDISQEKYEEVIANVLKKYKKVKNSTPAEIVAFTKELKSHWKSIKGEVDKASKKTAKSAK